MLRSTGGRETLWELLHKVFQEPLNWFMTEFTFVVIPEVTAVWWFKIELFILECNEKFNSAYRDDRRVGWAVRAVLWPRRLGGSCFVETADKRCKLVKQNMLLLVWTQGDGPGLPKMTWKVLNHFPLTIFSGLEFGLPEVSGPLTSILNPSKCQDHFACSCCGWEKKNPVYASAKNIPSKADILAYSSGSGSEGPMENASIRYRSCPDNSTVLFFQQHSQIMCLSNCENPAKQATRVFEFGVNWSTCCQWATLFFPQELVFFVWENNYVLQMLILLDMLIFFNFYAYFLKYIKFVLCSFSWILLLLKCSFDSFPLEILDMCILCSYS